MVKAFKFVAGLEKKRKRDGDQPSGSFSDPGPPFHARYFSGCESSYFQSYWHQEDKQFQLGSSNIISQSISIPIPTLENNSNRKSEKSSQSVTEPRKRLRPFRWQRERKRRLLDPGSSCNSTPCTSMFSGKNTLHVKPPNQLSDQSSHSHKVTSILWEYIKLIKTFFDLRVGGIILKRHQLLYFSCDICPPKLNNQNHVVIYFYCAMFLLVCCICLCLLPFTRKYVGCGMLLSFSATYTVCIAAYTMPA